MKLSTVNAYRHNRPVFNTTHFDAWAIARRCMAFGWHNLRYWFMPPIIEGVTLQLGDPAFEHPDEEEFTLGMFEEEGFLHEEMLNHYIVFRPFGHERGFSVNAGYLLHHFVMGEKVGYAELARVVKHYQKKFSTTPEDVGKESSPNNGNPNGDNSESA